MSVAASRAPTHDGSGRRQQQGSQTQEEDDSRQRLVLPDPTAFKLLREDVCAKVVDAQVEVQGFELYIVEQWACSRTQPTFAITTFTGLAKHKILAGVLSIPKNNAEWSSTLRSYLDAAAASHARQKDTPQGMLMVTNLSNFPSALTVILVPDGDLKTYRDSFVINENLKRLGCSGRAGLTLTTPSGATAAKFVQQYHIHETVPVSEAVVTLVRLCQIALTVFDMLAPLYVDGLLCDMTESAITRWWTKFGTDYYSVEPSDGILGPITVSALLGLFMGARNRLNSFGGHTVKDAFDVNAMERSINYYQRSQKLSVVKHGRLDRQTLDSLHRSTSKAANNERWLVPRAVKSTVAEFGGKGGEMVMGIVGRDKAGIAEIETLDIGKFSEVVSGRHSRWLWQGRSKKTESVDLFGGALKDDEPPFSGDEMSWDIRAPKMKTVELANRLKTPTIADPFYSNSQHESQSSLEALDKDSALRRNVLKSMTDRMSDARSGIGRFREAMGRTGLRNTYPKGLSQTAFGSSLKPQREQVVEEPIPKFPPRTPPRGSEDRKPEDFQADDANAGPELAAGPYQSPSPKLSHNEIAPEGEKASAEVDHQRPLRRETLDLNGSRRRQTNSIGRSASQKPSADLFAAGAETLGPLRTSEDQEQMRSRSLNKIKSSLPRQMSASAIDTVKEQRDPAEPTETREPEPSKAMTKEQILTNRNTSLLQEIERLGTDLEPFTESKLCEIERLAISLEQERAELEYEYAEKINEHRALQEGTSDLLAEEEAILSDTLKDLEILGARLEYELSTLVSKVEDVEDGVIDFEHQVDDLEARLESLGSAEPRKRPWPMRALGL